jgi:hypothetical protein
LKKLLKSQVQQNNATALLPHNTAAVGAGAAAINRPRPGPIPIDIVWNNGAARTEVGMMIETTSEGHCRVAETLDLLRKYGTMQIKIEVRFATGPADALKKAKLNWTVLPSELPASAGPNYDGGPTMPSPFDRSFDTAKGPRPIRSQFTIEKISPMMYDILDTPADKRFLEQWMANKQAKMLAAPTLLVLNGNSAFVSNCSQTPFVVAIVEGQPQIRVVHDGTTMQLRPVADAQDKLKLDFRVTSTTIRGVETANLSIVSKGKPVSIQVPEVEKSCVEGGIDLPWNRWLLLGGMERKGDKGGSSEVLIVMLRAEKVVPVQERADRSERAADVAPIAR